MYVEIVRFQVLTTDSTKIVFWDVAPYSLVQTNRRFRGTYCLHHRGDSPQYCTQNTKVTTMEMETVFVSETLVTLHAVKTQNDVHHTAVRTLNLTQWTSTGRQCRPARIPAHEEGQATVYLSLLIRRRDPVPAIPTHHRTGGR
jgi:hypothetical protein